MYRIILSLLAVLLPVILQAQSISKAGFPYMQSYTAEDYGAHIQNWAFAADSMGRMYVANNGGLLIFDGTNWDEISLPNYNVHEVAADEDGRIYVGGNGTVGYLDRSAPAGSGTATIFPEYIPMEGMLPDSISLGRVNGLISHDGYLYVNTSNTLLIIQGEDLRVHRTGTYFLDMYLHEGEVYVMELRSGIFRVTGGDKIQPGWGAYFADKYIMAHSVLGDTELFCTYNQCFKGSEGNFEVFSTGADAYFAKKYIDEVKQLQNGNLLFATRSGGLVYTDQQGGLIHILDENKGLSNNAVYQVYEDREGAVWAATADGITRLDYGMPFRRFDERTSLEEIPMQVFRFKDELYVVGNSGLYVWDSGVGAFRFREVGDACREVLKREDDFILRCGALYRGDENSIRQLRGSTSVLADVYNGDTLAVIGLEGLGTAILNDTNLNMINPAQQLPENYKRLQFDRQNRSIWVSYSDRGLIRYPVDPNSEIRDLSRAGLYAGDEERKESNFLRIEDKTVFLTSFGGMMEYDAAGDTLIPLQGYDGIFEELNQQILWADSDPDRNLWFIRQGSFEAVIKSDSDSSYVHNEGLLNRVNESQYNHIYAKDEGVVWISTDEGLIRYTKKHEYPWEQSFHTEIREVLVRNDSLINGRRQAGEAGHEMPELRWGDNELRFTYAAIQYSDPGRTEYRYRLMPFEENWSDWTSESRKDYTNIPEGDYAFEVQARNVYGISSTAEAFSFRVLPPWYRTWWAYVLYGIAIGLILWAAYTIRINQLLKVHRMRDRIASDLHDEVSATLSSISFFARAIEDDRVREDKGRFVQLIKDSAGDAKEKITDIVWAINPENDDWKAFLAKCRRFASDLLESRDLKYSLKIDEDIPARLDMELRQNLWMIYKEMVTNAVRHSGAGRLDVIMQYEHGVLTLVVQDDGEGLDEETVEKGNGLNNIRKRADAINAELELTSESTLGTRWKLTCKVS